MFTRMTLQMTSPVEETLAQAVARRVRGLLGEQRISQTAMAAELDMSQQAFSRRTTGRVAFSLDEISHLSELLSVSEGWLLGFVGEREQTGTVRHQGLEPRTR
jgi:transcriptional regulator with XRE-family HTH domain